MHHFILPILFLFSPPFISSQSISPNVAQDFGRIFFQSPNAVLQPKTLRDITNLISTTTNNTVAARGAGHSCYGQAQAPGGTIIDMRALPAAIQVVTPVDDDPYVDAGGGALWIDVLSETLKQGLTPRSWTDYLYLTVGGTLSVAGISGQTFKYGPQITNVLELDVITGKGEQITCSDGQNSDLFYGVLGGLGQFGIITRARIILKPAMKMAKRVTINYYDFDWFTRDQELMIKTTEVAYVEGFVSASRELNVSYSMELAIYYDDVGVAQGILDGILSQLGADGSNVNIVELSYFDFLNRVKAGEGELRKKGLWKVPHPWINLFVPKATIGSFKDHILQIISANYSGIIILYPTLKDKWNPKMSTVIPQDGTGPSVMYIVSLLRSAPPSCTSGTPCLDALILQNHEIIHAATGRMGAKQYIPFYKGEQEWMAHFGGGWDKFKGLKSRFDPLNILSPGQRIFKELSDLRLRFGSGGPYCCYGSFDG